MKTKTMKQGYALYAAILVCLLSFGSVNNAEAQSALQFDGTNDYVTFGTAAGLGSSTFTLECWIYKTGSGATTTTGTGGVTAVPIITKGRGEGETPANLNMNYFLGLDASNRLTADFEDKTNGGNHPITGTTSLSNNVWYHIAGTYDGTTWRLYINGNPEVSLAVGSFLPENTSIQHAGLGTALTSMGVAAGFFQGIIDEARIWNVARSQSNIRTDMIAELTSGTGLIGRWGLNDASGTTALNSVTGSPAGTLTNSPTWRAGITFPTELWAVQFDGTNDYVTFGQATSTLGASVFTLECWFMRTGTGTQGTTGSLGIENTAIPLLSKGRNETDGSDVDMNYWLGIDNATGQLAADFEDYATGLNHPVRSSSTISLNTWYHAAATYDGTTWRLYLNGNLENTLAVNQTPRYDSRQHAAIGSALNTGGTAAGFFAGVIDEARIWNVARTQAQIQADINQEIASAAGLIGRWSLDAGTGTVAANSIAGSPNGTLTNGPLWSFGAPFNITFEAPDAPPANLLVTPVSNSVLQLNWTDNSTNESSYEIERSTTGPEGPFVLQGTVAANVVTFSSTGLTPLTSYCYRVRAARGALKSDYTAPACGTTLNVANNAIDFGGTNAYVQVANSSEIQLSQFTIETWFRREGTGGVTTTGTNGIASAVPLIAKGCQEAEGPPTNINMNYFLGIDDGTDVICGDFEEPSGPNHPITGTTVIQNNVWYHAAFTFDGTALRLYLNGNLEQTVTPSPAVTCTAENISALGLGTSIQTGGTAYGFFDGILDEARIWNFARTGLEIQSTINSQLSDVQSGLVARWGLNEGSGTIVSSTAGTVLNGNITGANYLWVAGAPFSLNNLPPSLPTLNFPIDGAASISTSPTLNVTVSDPDGDNLTVSFYGRPAAAAAGRFSVIVLPDAQNYTSSVSGASPATFTAQTQWCVNNLTTRNIKYVSMVGDITNDNLPAAWVNANTSMSLLDATPPGIPYGIALGNHDYYNGPTLYGNYFPASRFAGRPYYGGAYDSNNENHYELFESGGIEFIVINLSSGDQSPTAAVLDWADALLKANTGKRGIIVNHSVVNTGNPATFTPPGQTIYDALRDNPNLFLMLGGHVAGEGRRSDTFNGNTVYSILADYQNEANGGNGWLRIIEFDPPNSQMHFTTYSPTLNQWKTTSTSQFDLPFISEPFQLIGSTSLPSGSSASIIWPDLTGNQEYEWVATVSDGVITVTSSVWSFTTLTPVQWIGGVNSDWNNNLNWSINGVPTTGEVVIGNVTNDPVISDVASSNNLIIRTGGSLRILPGGALSIAGDLTSAGSIVIESDAAHSGSLFVTGSSTGSVTYNRLMPIGSKWHYIASPVSLTASPEGPFYAWNEVAGDWNASATINLLSGVGYTLRTTGNSASFTGSLVAADFGIPVTSPYSDVISGSELTYVGRSFTGTGGHSGVSRTLTNYGGGGWNLLGNPYTSAISVSAFINANYSSTPASSNFDPNYVALYLFNGSTYNYVAQSTVWPHGTYLDATHIQVGQGFFVLAMNDNSTFNFSRSMQEPNPDVTLLKSAKINNPWPGLELKVKYGLNENSTLVVYNEDMTAGLDPGYDVGQLSSGSGVEIYTSLVEKDNSVNFAQQALPMTDFNKNIIPVGLDSEKGGEVTFSAFTVPLGNNKFWLEDRTTGIFTDLILKSYTVTLPAKTYGTGRFFIYASANTPTGIEEQAGDTEVRIWTSQEKLIIKGSVSQGAIVAVFDLQGNKVLETLLPDGSLNTVSMPAGSHGIYLVKVIDGTKVHTQKVVLL